MHLPIIAIALALLSPGLPRRRVGTRAPSRGSSMFFPSVSVLGAVARTCVVALAMFTVGCGSNGSSYPTAERSPSAEPMEISTFWDRTVSFEEAASLLGFSLLAPQHVPDSLRAPADVELGVELDPDGDVPYAALLYQPANPLPADAVLQLLVLRQWDVQRGRPFAYDRTLTVDGTEVSLGGYRDFGGEEVLFVTWVEDQRAIELSAVGAPGVSATDVEESVVEVMRSMEVIGTTN